MESTQSYKEGEAIIAVLEKQRRMYMTFVRAFEEEIMRIREEYGIKDRELMERFRKNALRYGSLP